MSAFFALLAQGAPLQPGYIREVLHAIEPHLAGWSAEGVVHHRLFEQGLLVSTSPVSTGGFVASGWPSPATRASLEKLDPRRGKAAVQKITCECAFVKLCEASGQAMVARDRMGVCPLYWVVLDGSVAVSSSLRALAAMPGVDRSLDDASVLDFLAFGMQRRPEATIFRDIWRFPPAFYATVDKHQTTLSRYWQLSIEEPLWSLSAKECKEQFRWLVCRATARRASTTHTGLMLSGGLDSALLGAALVGGLHGTPLTPRTTAFSLGFSGDPEVQLSTISASAMGIRQVVCLDAFQAGEVAQPPFNTPQPDPEPYSAAHHRVGQAVGEQNISTVLMGEDGDALLRPPTMIEMLLAGGPVRTAVERVRNLRQPWRRPDLGWTRQARRWGWKPPATVPRFPWWIRPEAPGRDSAYARWQQAWNDDVVHPWRPRSYADLTDAATLCNFFESLSPEWTGTPTDYRLPFFDLDLVSWALRVPPWPWCLDKRITRELLRPLLPAVIVDRPKTGFTLPAERSRPSPENFDHIHPALNRWVDLAGIGTEKHNPSQYDSPEARYRILGLSRWMKDLEGAR